MLTDTGKKLLTEAEILEFFNTSAFASNSTNQVNYFYTNTDGTTSILKLELIVRNNKLTEIYLKDSNEKTSSIETAVKNQEEIVSVARFRLPKPKPKPKPKKPKITKEVPYKKNGGTIKKDFISEHAYKRHKYDPSRKSTSNRTQYGKNIDVAKLRKLTMSQPDQAWSHRDKGGPWRTFYKKQFNKNISTKDTPTTHHRVIINTADSSKNTQFPLSFKN
ncbi:Hook-associated protein 2 [Bacillus swezeyi]|uniref:Hook-associated protein 2 n=1 Tax=Bacillus swezeyi TaxID=1925020 RepID=UPI001CC2656C|nr:Hook-associated protein 2 [Bacillus swezeyi]